MTRNDRFRAGLAAPLLSLLIAGCGGSTPAHDAIQGEATGDYTGISGADTAPRMQMIEIDTIPAPDTMPIPRPPPPR
jgi:hypothetical protein